MAAQNDNDDDKEKKKLLAGIALGLLALILFVLAIVTRISREIG